MQISNPCLLATTLILGGGTPGPGSTSSATIAPRPQGQEGGAQRLGPTNDTTIVSEPHGQGGGTPGPVPVKNITIVPRHQVLPATTLRLGPVKNITIIPRHEGQGGGTPGPANSTTIVPPH